MGNRPSVRYDVTPSPALQGRAVALLDREPDLQLIGYSRLPGEPIRLADAGAIVVPLEQDPQFQAGALDIPWSKRRVLAKLERRQVVFDQYLLLHELDPRAHAKLSSTPADKLTSLIPAPTIDPVAAKLTSGMAWATDAAVEYGPSVALGIAALVLAPLALPILVGGALIAAGVDPVLIGALTADGTRLPGQPAAFFEIVRWQMRS